MESTGLLGFPMIVLGFEHWQVQVHVDHLYCKVHVVPTRETDTVVDAALIILKIWHSSGERIPNVLVVDHDPKFMSALFKAREFTLSISSTFSSLLIGSAYHKKHR